MTSLLMAVLLGAVMAAPDNAEAPAGAQFKIWAVEVHSEGRDDPHFDKGLEEIQEALQDGKHDTYVNLKTAKHAFNGGESVTTPLTERYTLSAGPPQAAEDGRYRVKLRLTMKPPKKSPNPLQADSLLAPDKTQGKDIEALSSELLLQPDKKVVVRGLKSDDGKEMVLVVSLSVPEKAKSAR